MAPDSIGPHRLPSAGAHTRSSSSETIARDRRDGVPEHALSRPVGFPQASQLQGIYKSSNECNMLVC
jgi:hypothetical protein